MLSFPKTDRLLWAFVCLAAVAAAQGFSYTKGPLQQARAGQAAVVLTNGDVLLIGGENNGTALASAELYDPASQGFTATGSMSEARVDPQAQLLPNGDVIVFGGQPDGTNLSSEIYDPKAGTFTAGPGLNVALGGLVSAALNDGRIFLAGVVEGCGASPEQPCPAPVYVYDPKANTLTQAATLPISITGETATTLSNGSVLLYGGFPGVGTSPVSQYFVFDPKTGAVTEGNGGGIYKASAVGLNDGTALICGGSDHGSDVGQLCEIYDPSTQAVSNTTGVMESSRIQPTMTLLPDGRVLVAGGNSGQKPDAEIYDPKVETFSSAGNFEAEREDFTASLLGDGTVLFAGGDDGQLNGAALSSAELFQSAAPQPDFSVAAANTIVTINTGSSAEFQIAAHATGGFNSSITLSCTGDSALQCAFAPAMISPAGTSTLTVTGFNLSSGGVVKFNVVGTSGKVTHTLALELALEPPVPTVAPATLSFGDEAVGKTSDAQTVSLANSGEGRLTLGKVAASGDFAQTNNCPASLGDGAPGCTITVTFAPTAGGNRTGTLSITDNAPFSPQTVQLSGTGEDPAAPASTLAPTQLSFGQQTVGASSSPQTVTLSNSGNADLTLTSIVAKGQYQQSNNCPSVLAAGKSCAVSVVFSPADAGTQNGSVQFTDNASGSPQQVTMTGVGVAAAAAGASLTPAQLTFASQAVSTTSAAQNVTLASVGAAALVISQISASGGFAETNNCPGTLAAGQQCTIAVTATAPATGTFTGTLSVRDNASNSPQTVPLQGTGAAAASPVTIQAAPGGSETASVSAGNTATFNLQLSSSNGFTGTVTLSCTGAPAGSTCSPSPASATIGAAPTPVSVKVTTTGGSSAAFPGGGFPLWPLLPLCLFPLAAVWRRRRRLIPAAAAAAMVLSLAACGGSPVQTSTTPTPTGTYALRVTATSGSASGGTIEGTTQLALTVQ